MINWFGTTLPGNLEAFDLEMLARGARAANAMLAARKWGNNAQNDPDFIAANNKHWKERLCIGTKERKCHSPWVEAII